MGRFIFVSFSLLVVFLSLSGIEAGFCCPFGWSSFGQHCYKVFKPLKNWTDAEAGLELPPPGCEPGAVPTRPAGSWLPFRGGESRFWQTPAEGSETCQNPFQAGEKFCTEQHKGSRLASIHSSEEEAFVSKLASKILEFGSVWIGLNDPWKDCKWEWSDNAKFDYKPLIRRPYCTVMVLKPDRIFWFNRGCEKSVSFVCKFLA